VTLIEQLESKSEALRANDLAALCDVTPQHIYKMAARGTIPSFRVAAAIRFDPQKVARWLITKGPLNLSTAASVRAA
jgi:predicted DNA-binding transcriptional regulator AlpA